MGQQGEHNLLHLQRLQLQLSINILLLSTSVPVSFFLVVSPDAVRAILFAHKSLESAFIPVLNAQPHVEASFRQEGVMRSLTRPW